MLHIFPYDGANRQVASTETLKRAAREINKKATACAEGKGESRQNERRQVSASLLDINEGLFLLRRNYLFSWNVQSQIDQS